MSQEALPDPFAEIVNVDLDSEDPLGGLQPPRRRTLYILWRGGTPVGKYWLKPTQLPSSELARFCNSLPDSKAAPTAIRSDDRTTVSIVVCTRERPSALARCLSSLQSQSRSPDQILVVDNGSPDGATRAAAKRAGADYVREERRGLSFARNKGVAAASGELIVFTDDDAEPATDWLENLVIPFAEDNVDAVTGLVLPASLDTLAQWMFEDQWSFARGFERQVFDSRYYRRHRWFGMPSWRFGAGANMAFRRRTFERYGPFDTRLGAGASGCSEDSEYWYRIAAHGGTCAYEPRAIVYHHHRPTIEELERQIFLYLRGHVTGLFVQFERTGDIGNLWRAFVVLPAYYLRRSLGVLRHGRTGHNRLLNQEISGLLSGYGQFFELRRNRPA
jgi:glycosyltransferase involved in cell wall biosynthesis